MKVTKETHFGIQRKIIANIAGITIEKDEINAVIPKGPQRIARCNVNVVVKYAKANNNE